MKKPTMMRITTVAKSAPAAYRRLRNHFVFFTMYAHPAMLISQLHFAHMVRLISGPAWVVPVIEQLREHNVWTEATGTLPNGWSVAARAVDITAALELIVDVDGAPRTD